MLNVSIWPIHLTELSERHAELPDTLGNKLTDHQRTLQAEVSPVCGS